MSKVADINKEYFGEDKKKTYIKDDFTNVLHSAIQREVFLNILNEVSKAQHTEEEHENGSVSFGYFDPDNAGLLISIQRPPAPRSTPQHNNQTPQETGITYGTRQG